MSNFDGTTLLEVLIALAIFSICSLALMQHEWQLIKQYQYQLQSHQQQQTELDEFTQWLYENSQ